MRRFVPLLALAAAGCGIFDVFYTDTIERLHKNRKEWDALGLSDYDYTYQRVCFCANVSVVRIGVRDDTLHQVVDVATGLELPRQANLWPTVDSIFAWVERDARAGFDLKITYDGTLRFPGRVEGDLKGAIDDEYTLTAVNLSPVYAPPTQSAPPDPGARAPSRPGTPRRTR